MHRFEGFEGFLAVVSLSDNCENLIRYWLKTNVPWIVVGSPFYFDGLCLNYKFFLLSGR